MFQFFLIPKRLQRVLTQHVVVEVLKLLRTCRRPHSCLSFMGSGPLGSGFYSFLELFWWISIANLSTHCLNRCFLENQGYPIAVSLVLPHTLPLPSLAGSCSQLVSLKCRREMLGSNFSSCGRLSLVRESLAA